MDWFRWWHGTVTDPKMQWVARKSKQPVAVVIAVWACLLECASDVTQCNADVTRGSVLGFDCNDYDVLLGLEDGTCYAVLHAFEEKGMVDCGRIAAWDSRQPKREDSSAARVAAHRARKKEQQNVSENNDVKLDVTQCNAPDKDTDTEKEEELKTKTIGAAVACAASEHDPIEREFKTSVPFPAKPKPEKQPKPESKGTRLADDWVLPDDWKQLAMEENPTWDDEHVRRVAAKFKIYWTEKTGKDALKKNWKATWHNWVLSEYNAKPAHQPLATRPRFANQPLPQTKQQFIGDAAQLEDGTYAF